MIPELTEIVIPLSVTSIGSNGFNGCNDLLKITIDPYAAQIDSSAFI